MEFRQHLDLLWKERTSILFFGFLTFFIALFIVYIRPVQYQASIAFGIQLQNRQQTDDYRYDDYYALKAAELLGDTVMSWFLIPSVVNEMYAKADMAPPNSFFDFFGTFFKTKKYSAQYVAVTFQHPSEDVTRRLSKAVIEVVEQKSRDLNSVSAEGQTTFRVQAEPAVIVLEPRPYFVAGGIALFVGLCIGVFGVYVRRYFQPTSRT